MKLTSLKEMSSRIRSLYIIHFVMFVMSLSGSTIYTGLEPYLERVSKGFQYFNGYTPVLNWAERTHGIVISPSSWIQALL